MTITIEDIRNKGPCYDPSKYLSENWIGTTIDILKMNEVSAEDRIWVVTRFLSDKINRLWAVDCAREALKLVENPDPRSIEACDVAEKFANGEATTDELAAAGAAAGDAAWAARAAAGDAARAAAGAAARDARDAAGAAARDARDAAGAAGDAARAAAWAARAAAWAARDAAAAARAAAGAARAAAGAAARAAAGAKQIKQLIKFIEEEK